MKKYLSRMIAGLLLAVMVVTCIPVDVTLAAETNVETEESVDLKKDAPEEETEEQEQTDISEETETEEEQISEESLTDNKSVESEEQNQEKEAVRQDDKSSKDSGEVEEKVNFVYIESPYLETPGTQRIVFAFESALESAEAITLTVEDGAGNQEDWPLAKQKGGVYLFEKEYSSEAATDTYHAVSLNLTVQGEKRALNLSEQGIEAEFGVNKEYDGLEDLEPIEGDPSEVSEDIEASVVTIDENGVTKAQDNIADALNAVSAETTGARTLSASARTASARSEDIIVALDPGHDSRSTGASANGLKEEVLTLKIAKYCKEELEKYEGVEVYMTRTGADCPFKMNGSGCIQKRVNAAADAGAQIFVSFHLNSSNSSSAKGAEVIVQNSNWKPAVGADSEELGQAILDELVKVGLSDRGIYTKNAQQNKYKDKSAADYYAVNRYSKLQGIPGIIIEHAFISNKDDANKYLKTESGLKKLGVADATGIAKYLGLSKDTWTKPVLKETTATYQGTKINWSSVKGATGYAVYRGTSTENWKMIDTTTSTSYLDTESLSSGQTYYYTVRAYRGDEEEALANKYSSTYWTSYDSDGVKVVFMSTPHVSNTSTASSGIKVSWKAVSGVSGYGIYRKTEGSDWKMIAMTTGTSYTDKDGLKSGEEYSYTLRAYKGNASTASKNKYSAQYWSSYDNEGKQGRYIATPNLKEAEATPEGRKLSWGSVSGATGYAVYRKVSGGDWAMFDTTTGTTYTDESKLSAGKTYYYTVRAYVGDVETAKANRYESAYWGHYEEDGLKTVYLDTPALKGITTATSSLKVSWSKVSGATGYAVYRKAPGGSWGMIGTTTSTSYTDKKGMTGGVSYYYTVRAYKGNVTTAKKHKYIAQYWSGYDAEGKQGRYIATPKLKKAEATPEGRKLSWGSVSGVTGYAVYRKVSGGDWAMFDTTTGTTYTDGAKLSAGKTYYYTVRAYVGDVETAKANRYESAYWGHYEEDGLKTVYLDTPALKGITTATSSLKVSWSKVSGATGYAVYRKAPGGSWGMIGTTTSTSYTDKKGMTGGVSYYYTVRAYKGNVTTAKNHKYTAQYWSGYDADGITNDNLSTPVLNTNTKVINMGLEIAWKKVDGATGYAVYRKAGSADWKMIGTSESSTYVDCNVGSSGTIYDYTVRAYRGDKDIAIAHKYDKLYCCLLYTSDAADD